LGKDSIQNKLAKKTKEDLKYAIIPVDWKSIVKDQDSNTNVTLFLVKLKWQLSMKGLK
jgi:hypothetical protein